MRKVRFGSLLIACVIAAGCSESGSSNDGYGKACSEGEQCEGGLVCVDNVCQQSLSMGDKCGFMYTFCSEGECLNGVCAEASSGGQVDTKCSNSNPCQNGKICVSGKCVEPVAPGGLCGRDEDCSQGKCVDNKCTLVVGVGQACGEGRNCEGDLTCADGICKTSVAIGGSCASSHTFCGSGVCSRGMCVEGEVGNCDDSDGDGISDEYDRCDVDTDGDGKPDCMDDDSDGDGIPDEIEKGNISPCAEPVDSDSDNKYDFLDEDSDGNGILDKDEGVRINADGSKEIIDTDGDGVYDFASPDNDGDFTPDVEEIAGIVNPKYASYGGNPPRGADCYNAEKDVWGVWGYGKIVTGDDGKPQYVECDPADGDKACQPRMGDLKPDEIGTSEHPFDCDGDTIPDYVDKDSDGDGISDFLEGRLDSDNDGYLDRYELDSDDDGISDKEEAGSDPNLPLISFENGGFDFQNPDVDSDGLNDGLEVICKLKVTCAEGQMYCGDSCIDVTADKNNCGGCGITCTSDESCSSGECVLSCADGLLECNRFCYDPNTIDNHNCGDCNAICDAHQNCEKDESGETPVIQCVDADESVVIACEDTEGKSYCWGQCIDSDSYLTDASNCGGCGVVCESGKCTDGVCDPVEVTVPGAPGMKEVNSRFLADADGDTIGDAIEYIAAEYKCQNAANYSSTDEWKRFCDANSAEYRTEFICDPQKGAISDSKLGIEGAFDFYFVLPYGDPEQQDILNFKPQVSKLDVVFDLDTTNSMGPEVQNLKDKINAPEANGGIIAQIRKRVEDSAFGVVRFDDFPTRPTKDSDYDHLKGNGIEDGGYGRVDDCPKGTETQNDLTKPFKCDIPFKLEGRPETTASTVQNNVNKLSLHHGGDFPEAGYESLWQIVMGDDVNYAQVSWYRYGDYTAFKSGSIAYTKSSTDRWGGAQFRNNTLPVVVHITDTTAHDSASNCTCDDDKSKQNCTCKPYDPTYVENAHYSDKVHSAYQEKGARIITVYDGGVGNADKPLTQLFDTSKATQAIVPACAFKDESGAWKCGENHCCTTVGGEQSVEINGKKQCILSYAIESGTELSTTLVDGVDAIVKYAASDVAAIVKGNPIPGYDDVDTSCFISGVVAFETTTTGEGDAAKTLSGYVAPPQEPEKSCNPVAVPEKYNDSAETNGYTNFAIGTSSSDKEGAQLNFIVKAQNSCVKATTEMQVFEAVIELVEPKTGMSYGERKVSIVVPGVSSGSVY